MLSRVDAAALIKQARTRSGMTQAALAAAAGTSQPAVAAYESGAKSPSVRTLDRLVRAAGATLEVTLHDAPAARGSLLADVRHHRQELRELARGHHMRNIRVFGSVARGEETDASDIDLLVDFDAERHGLLLLAGFIESAGRLLGRTVDAAPVGMLRETVRERALAEAVPL